MKKTIVLPIIAIVSLVLAPLTAFSVSWPATFANNGDILIDVSGNHEPSGITWNPVTNKLFVVCNTGQVTIMNSDGTGQETTKMPSYMDFEAITIVDPSSTKAFIGLENRDSILEYDWQDKELTGKTWDLSSIMTGPSNQGLEGLAFIPNEYHPFTPSASGGLFYAGIQRTPSAGGSEHDDYLIYAFDIDLSSSGSIVSWRGIPVPPGTPTSDVSGLFFSEETGILYVLYDGSNRIVEMTTGGEVISTYSNVPISAQEGIAIITNPPEETSDIYLASDSHKLLGWFSGYPITYRDNDGDGASYLTDCDDNDDSVSENRPYYQDLDEDGLGSDVSTVSCHAPEGYVANSDDLNDNDHDNDGIVTARDCDDADPTSPRLLRYFEDLDGDGWGNADVSGLYCEAPANYVPNRRDTDDTDPSVH